MDRTVEICVEATSQEDATQGAENSLKWLSDHELVIVGGGIGNTIL